MTSRNERTAPDIASHAAKVLKMDDAQLIALAMQNPELIRRIAASALTQAEDRPIGEPPPPKHQVVQSGVKFPFIPVANKVKP